MLIVADSAVNSSQKVLTQIMLNQEETFRNQMSSSRSMKNHCPQMCRDLNDTRDFFGPSYGSIPSELSAIMKYDVHESKSSSMEGLELSLRVGSYSRLEDVELCGDASCKNMSTKRKLFDLNKAVLDESYVHSNDHYIFNSSSSDVSHNEVFEYGKGTNSTLTTSPSEDSSEKTRQNISISEPNLEKRKEEKQCSNYSNQILLEGSDSNKSPVSCKSDLIKDDLSSNSNVKSQSFDQKNEEFAEIDLIMKRGAASLTYFSSSKNQDDFQEAKRLEQKRCSIEREVPQSSSESYEAIVLKQAESEEYCVSSTPYRESGFGDKDYHGRKFKRGRRMKDFRKEILPSLASLDRDEICEDIQIMKLAIRSREHKKCRVKNANIPSARSRRSRLSYR